MPTDREQGSEPMREDFWILIPIPLVWALLAAVYWLVPSLGMPGYARVWGAGAVLFLGLAGLLWRRRN